jgi:hypothetical protein
MTIRFFGYNPPDSKQTPCLITPFTGIHFLSGAAVNVLFRKLNIPYTIAFILWFVIHMLYELKDLHSSYVKKSDDYYHNHSLMNSVSDQLFALLGFIIGQSIPLDMIGSFMTIFALIVITAYIIKMS